MLWLRSLKHEPQLRLTITNKLRFHVFASKYRRNYNKDLIFNDFFNRVGGSWDLESMHFCFERELIELSGYRGKFVKIQKLS